MAKHIFRGKVYGETNNEWIGTKAEYELVKDTIPVGYKVIITDDVETSDPSKINDNVSMEYMKKIDGLAMAKCGRNLGFPAGYLRTYHKPKKVLIIGNSLTQHGPREADEIPWSVYDYREMSASTPTSGWVQQIEKYLRENINPEIEVYKTNGATWEVATTGTRKWENIGSNPIYQATSSGPVKYGTMTLDDFANTYGEEVDIVICQLFENCPAPADKSSDADVNTEQEQFTADYVNLYREFHNRFPNARRYQFNGFLGAKSNISKRKAITAACRNAFVETIEPYILMGLSTFYNTNEPGGDFDVYARAGDPVYDAKGNQIATVSDIVAGHPNDLGFAYMAAQTIFVLFNANFPNYQVRGVLDMKKKQEKEKLFTEPTVTEIYDTTLPTTVKDGNAIGYKGYLSNLSEIFNHLLLPGYYRVTISVPEYGARHGILYINGMEPGVEKNSNIPYNLEYTYTDSDEAKASGGVYQPLEQRWVSMNYLPNSGNSDFEIKRFSILAAKALQWGPFKWSYNIQELNANGNFHPTGEIFENKPVYRRKITTTATEAGEVNGVVLFNDSNLPISKVVRYTGICRIPETGAVVSLPNQRLEIYTTQTGAIQANLNGEINNEYIIIIDCIFKNDLYSIT